MHETEESGLITHQLDAKLGMGIHKYVTSGKTSCMFKSSREVALFVHHSTIIRVVKLVGWDAILVIKGNEFGRLGRPLAKGKCCYG